MDSTATAGTAGTHATSCSERNERQSLYEPVSDVRDEKKGRRKRRSSIASATRSNPAMVPSGGKRVSHPHLHTHTPQPSRRPGPASLEHPARWLNRVSILRHSRRRCQVCMAVTYYGSRKSRHAYVRISRPVGMPDDGPQTPHGAGGTPHGAGGLRKGLVYTP